MAYDLKELLALPNEEKKELIAELMDSFNLEDPLVISEWKAKLYKERIDYYKENSTEGTDWNELRKKYFQ